MPVRDWAYVPLHQQALAWGVSNKVKVVQRPDNQILFYWIGNGVGKNDSRAARRHCAREHQGRGAAG